MAGIVGGLEDVLGLNTTAGTAELQQALAALQAVGVPTIAQLTLPELQKYVAAGVLSPQQYQAISADPNTFQQIAGQADMSGQNAQKAALSQLGGIVNAGGSTAINQANLLNNVNQTNQAMQAARGGIEENARERGVAGSGLEYINKLMNEQSNAQNANTGAVNAAANNAQLALQAMTQGGQLGGQLQNQSSSDALAKAQAAQQIQEYNSQLQSAANQYNTQNANQAQQMNLTNAQNISNANTGNTNQRTMYNAQLPQTVYGDQMQKAQGLANAYGNMGQLKQQQAAGQNQFIGGLIGAGATMGGDYMLGQGLQQKSGALAEKIPGGATDPSVYPGYAQNNINNQPFAHGGEVKGDESEFEDKVPGPESSPSVYRGNDGRVHVSESHTAAHGGEMCYAQGGEVHDHRLCMMAGGTVPGDAEVPGDSTQNDTIHAALSPHEIVLPRTVAQAPNAPEAAAQFVGGIKGQPPPLSFADVVKKLEENGLELRIGAL